MDLVAKQLNINVLRHAVTKSQHGGPWE